MTTRLVWLPDGSHGKRSVDRRALGRPQREGREGFGEVKGEIRDLRAEIHAMQRTMIIGFASIVASIAGSVIGGLVVTQL
jgi:hypothetical protein